MVLLFVYGTLMYGMQAHHLLVGSIFAGRGCVRGRLYICDGYPLLVTMGDGCVWGELYHIESAMLPRIDHYEGADLPASPWKRIRVKVDILGLEVEAIAYGLKSREEADKLCESLEHVETGDYRSVAGSGPPRWLVATPPYGSIPPGIMLGSRDAILEGILEGDCIGGGEGELEATVYDLLSPLEALREWAEELGCRLGGVAARIDRRLRVYPVAPVAGARG